MPLEITEKNLSTASLMIDRFLHSKEGIEATKQLSEEESSLVKSLVKKFRPLKEKIKATKQLSEEEIRQLSEQLSEEEIRQHVQSKFGTNFFVAIQNNIRAIEKAQMGWLKKSGKIEKYENELKFFNSHKAILAQLNDEHIEHLFVLFYKNNRQKELDDLIYNVNKNNHKEKCEEEHDNLIYDINLDPEGRELKKALEDMLKPNKLEKFESFSECTANMDDYTPKPPSQDELITEAINTHINTKNFTHITVKNLIMQIESKIDVIKDKESVTSKVLHDFLQKLQTEITAVIDHFNKPPDTKSNDVVFNTLSKEEYIALGNTKVCKYARSLCCKFIPFGQGVTDVLFGEAKGFCAGYVTNWAHNIYHGLYQGLPRIEAKTFFFHRYQVNYVTEVKDLYHSESGNPLISIMDELINLVSSKYIYEVALRREKYGHSIGLRKIPGTDAFEVFDPNVGIYVFSNSEDFKKWFAFLLNSYSGIKRVTLNQIISQSSNAQSTIPLDDLKPDCQFLKNSIVDIKNQYLEEYEIRSQFKEIMDIDQALKSIERNHLLYSAYFVEAESKGISFEPIDDIMPSLCNMKADNYIAENKRIKTLICNRIDVEVKRLGDVFFGKDKAKLKQLALNDLKGRIQSASSAISLEAIINKWLLDKRPNNRKTNQEILAEKRTCGIYRTSKSTSFISRLLKNYDMCPYRLNLLREALLKKILYAFEEPSIDLRLIRDFNIPFNEIKTLLGPVQSIIREGLNNKETARSILENLLDQKHLRINEYLKNLNVDCLGSLKEFYDVFSNRVNHGREEVPQKTALYTKKI